MGFRNLKKISAKFTNELTQLPELDMLNCDKCSEVIVQTTLDARLLGNRCRRCRDEFRGTGSDPSHIYNFSSHNNMNPGVAPDCLRVLTMIEANLISLLLPVKVITYLPYGSVSSKGSCVSIPQDVNVVATSLPQISSEFSTIVVQNMDFRGTLRAFTVRRSLVERALRWPIQKTLIMLISL